MRTRSTGSWVAPFMMAGINTKAVHRSNLLLGHAWGRDFKYDEMLMTDGPPAGGPAAGRLQLRRRPDAQAGRRAQQGRA